MHEKLIQIYHVLYRTSRSNQDGFVESEREKNNLQCHLHVELNHRTLAHLTHPSSTGFHFRVNRENMQIGKCFNAKSNNSNANLLIYLINSMCVDSKFKIRNMPQILVICH